MCSVGGSMSPSGTNGTIGATSVVAELAGDRLGRAAEHEVVLAGHQVRPVLLDAAGRHDHRVLPAFMASRTSIQVRSSMNTRIDRLDRPRRIRIRGDRIRQHRQEGNHGK